MQYRTKVATLAAVTALTALACAPQTPQVGTAAKCATDPATGKVYGMIGDPVCGPGTDVVYVNVECGPLTLATGDGDVCVRAHVVGDGTSTGVRGIVIVPRSYLSAALGDVELEVVS